MIEEKFSVQPAFHLNPWGYSIRFGSKNPDGSYNMAEPVTTKRYDPADGLIYDKAMMLVERPALQTLMDGLWNVGIRPSDIGTAGHLAATQSHLGDMKKLVEKAYEIKF